MGNIVIDINSTVTVLKLNTKSEVAFFNKSEEGIKYEKHKCKFYIECRFVQTFT